MDKIARDELKDVSGGVLSDEEKEYVVYCRGCCAAIGYADAPGDAMRAAEALAKCPKCGAPCVDWNSTKNYRILVRI